MKEEDLRELLTIRSENEHVEFKEAKSNFHFDKLVDYCVALGNEGGGYVILGVSDKPPRSIVGTRAFLEPERTVSGLFDRLRIKVRVHEMTLSEGRVLVFQVPGRPKGSWFHHNGKILMRAGESLEPMSEDMLRSILMEAGPPFIERASTETLEEADIIALLDVQSFFDLRKLPLPATRTEILKALMNRKMIIGEKGGYVITNMGALLFAKDIERFPSIAHKSVRVIVYDGISKSKVKDGKDKQGKLGYAAGFERLMAYIKGEIAGKEEYVSGARTVQYSYPIRAIRELVGNALVHQDLNEHGSAVKVEIYSDRIEISNPGLPVLDVERFIDEDKSRNLQLAAEMRRFNLYEGRGQGMDEVVSLIEIHQLPPYEVRLGTRQTTVILSRYRPLKELTQEEKINAVYQHCVLRYVTNRLTNNESVRERFKIDAKNSAVATRLLGDAVKAGRIRLVDASAGYRSWRYVPYWGQ
jgi:ATP-dependent DNA helicase RecG